MSVSKTCRRALAVLLALALLALLPLPASASSPEIYITYVPEYGVNDKLEGKVVGGADGLKVALWLQVEPGGIYWPKPYDNERSVTPSADGTFSYTFVTGGEDKRATLLHLMLVPESLEVTTFAATRAAAKDYVLVSRSSSGETTISPDRRETYCADPFAGAGGIAVDVGFRTTGAQSDPITEESIRAQFDAIKNFAGSVRIYGTSGDAYQAYAIAREYGFKIAANAWISGDAEADAAEISALIEHCAAGNADLAVVGSETLLRRDQTEAELVEKLLYVGQRVSVPVTTADTEYYIRQSLSVRNACDVVFVNLYPYWEGEAIDGAAEEFISRMEALSKRCGGKAVLCSETGWPTEGQTISAAEAGTAEAAAYFEAVRLWSVRSGTTVFFFEAADEAWKTSSEGAAGAHWGILDGSFRVKDGFTELDFFKNAFAFPDVPISAPYSGAVGWCAMKRIVIGSDKGEYMPTSGITRGQFAIMLCRAFGFAGTEQMEIPFVDAGSRYYTPYVNTLKALGISNGVGGNKYEPDRIMTVQEMCAMLYRSFNALGALPEGGSGKALEEYADAGSVAGWARTELTWLCASGRFVPGYGEAGAEQLIHPTDTADRAKMAVLFMNMGLPE